MEAETNEKARPEHRTASELFVTNFEDDTVWTISFETDDHTHFQNEEVDDYK